MLKLQQLFDAWETGHFELSCAFKELPDAGLWSRPHPNLLSIGEIVGHIGYGEATRCFAKGEFPFETPFLDERFRYYVHTIGEPVIYDLDAKALIAEIEKVHKVSIENVRVLDPSPEGKIPWLPGDWWTWQKNIEYMCFHVAYHTGQIYSVRHMFGHVTDDN